MLSIKKDNRRIATIYTPTKKTLSTLMWLVETGVDCAKQYVINSPHNVPYTFKHPDFD